jgi:hypothetical protein
LKGGGFEDIQSNLAGPSLLAGTFAIDISKAGSLA